MDCRYKGVREDCLQEGLVIKDGDAVCKQCYIRDNHPAEYMAIKHAGMIADAFFGKIGEENEKESRVG